MSLFLANSAAMAKPSGIVALGGLSDNFDAGSIDAAKWQVSGVTVSQTSGRLQMSGASVAHLRSVNAYNLTGKTIRVRFISVPAPSAGYSQQFWAASDDAFTLRYLVQVFNGTLYFQDSTTGTLFSVAHDPVAHEYVQIRMIGGTTYFDTSADGVTWANLYSGATGVDITAMYVYLRNNWLSGGSVTHKWDDFDSDL